MQARRDHFETGMGAMRVTRRRFVLGTAGIIAAAVFPSGAALAATPVVQAHFVLTIDGETFPFERLLGITSEVDQQEYIYNDNSGKIIHTKQFGKNKPPRVVLRTAYTSADRALFAWHQAARAGKPSARKNVTLTAIDAQGTTVRTYLLANAWCSSLDVSGMKAGATEVGEITITIQCDQIIAR